MDAKDLSVIAVLSDQKRFMVPIYRRQYAWGERQWDFWNDIVAKAEEVLDRQPHFQHYMGALILVPGRTIRSIAPPWRDGRGRQGWSARGGGKTGKAGTV